MMWRRRMWMNSINFKHAVQLCQVAKMQCWWLSPNFTKDKCGKCKTVKYCSVNSRVKIWKFQKLYVNRVTAFKKLISEIVSFKPSNGGGKFLSLEQFTARIKPWYHDHIVKKTFLLGAIKFSSEKYSNIDISATLKLGRCSSMGMGKKTLLKLTGLTSVCQT